jgi:hypothetical protein
LAGEATTLREKFKQLCRDQKDLREALKAAIPQANNLVLCSHIEEIVEEIVMIPKRLEEKVYWNPRDRELFFSPPKRGWHLRAEGDCDCGGARVICKIKHFAIPSEWRIGWCEDCGLFHNLDRDGNLDHNKDATKRVIKEITRMYRRRIESAMQEMMKHSEETKAASRIIGKHIKSVLDEEQARLDEKQESLVLMKNEDEEYSGLDLSEYDEERMNRDPLSKLSNILWQAIRGERYIRGNVTILGHEKMFSIVSQISLGIAAVPVRHFFIITKREQDRLTVTRISRAKYKLLGGQEEDVELSEQLEDIDNGSCLFQ